METITYSLVQDLITRLPITKLPLVYNWLIDLTTKEADHSSPQLDFMRLPLSERRRIMAQQAEQMVAHYEQMARERQNKVGLRKNDEIIDSQTPLGVRCL